MELSQLGDIALAWYRALNPTPEQHERSLARLAVCDTCEHKTPAVVFNGYTCGACGCPLHKKIFTEHPSGCPKGKWEV